jgi:hypothetical protein
MARSDTDILGRSEDSIAGVRAEPSESVDHAQAEVAPTSAVVARDPALSPRCSDQDHDSSGMPLAAGYLHYMAVAVRWLSFDSGGGSNNASSAASGA